MTKTSFAELVGVPASTIGRIESGEVDPTFSMLQRIARGAGFSLNETLTETGDDAPFAVAVDKVRAASGDERRRLIKRLLTTAGVAPIMKRPGARVFALDRPIADLVQHFCDLGMKPTVSSLEAVAGDISSTRSFAPVIYVERPEDVDLSPMSATSRSSVVVLPVTDNVRERTCRVNDVDMVVREWGILDALASPGRQAETAAAFLDDMVDAR